MRRTSKKLRKRELRPSSLWRRELARLLAEASRSTGSYRRRQRDVLCDVMLSANRRGAWLTLEELAMLTQYPPASISAQLRHLRKREFGGYDVEKRQRVSGRALHGEDFGTVWEYRLQRGARKVARSGSASRGKDRITSFAAA